MFDYPINETTTFWSEDELVELIREKDQDFVLKEGKKFSIRENLLPKQNFESNLYQCFLRYNYKEVLEFVFSGSFHWWEDDPTWEQQLDTNTQKPKFRLYIGNRHPVVNISGATEAPADIHICPDGYSPAMQMAWQYNTNQEGHNVIELFRVEDGQRHLIYTLTSTDFKSSDDSWLKARKPIAIHKHRSYITIRLSAHLARTWSIHESYKANVKYTGYTMSADETAWVSDDDWNVMKSFIKVEDGEPGGKRPRGEDAPGEGGASSSLHHSSRPRNVHICDLLDALNIYTKNSPA